MTTPTNRAVDRENKPQIEVSGETGILNSNKKVYTANV